MEGGRAILPRGLSELAHHQAYGGLADDLAKTLTDFHFMEAKVFALGAQPLIEDYDLAFIPSLAASMRRLEGYGKSLRLIQGAIRLSSHVLSRSGTGMPVQPQARLPLEGQSEGPALISKLLWEVICLNTATELRQQLLGRLLSSEAPEIQAMLGQAKQWKAAPWLRPLTQSLIPPGGPLVLTLDTQRVNAVAVTPDGRHAISNSNMFLDVWDLASGTVERTLRGHTAEVTAVAVTPDGRRAVSASCDKTLKVWELESGTELHTLTGHEREVTAVAVTPDGRRAISGSYDNTLKVWNLEGVADLRYFSGHAGAVIAVSVTPDGRYAISNSADRTLKVWDLESGAELRTFTLGDWSFTAVAVTPDGRHALFALKDRTFKVWDLETGAELRAFRIGAISFTKVAVTPDGRRAIFAWESILKVSDLTHPSSPIARFAGDSAILACTVALDGVTIVAGEQSGRVHLLRLEGI